MTVALYMDVQVNKSIGEGLRARGIDVLRAQDDGHEETPDRELLDHAASLGRVLVTFDKDFLVEAHRRQLENVRFCGIVFSRQNQVETGQWIAELEILATCLDAHDVADRVIDVPLH